MPCECYSEHRLTRYRQLFSGFGHDKSQAILPYRDLPNPPLIFFFGDGVSGESTRFLELSSRATPPISSPTLPFPLSVLLQRSPLTDNPPDMSAARHADVLFVKEKPDGENDLAAYCTRERIPHILFADFGRALGVVSAIVEGRTSAKQALDKSRAE